MTRPDLRRRLLLPARQLAAVLAAVGADTDTLPPALLDDDGGDDAPGVLAGDGRPHPSVAAGVVLVTTGPRLVLRAGTPWRRRITVLATGGGLGASLARDEQAPEPFRPVEQSLFGASLLGEELVRCLPPVPAAARAGRPALRSGDLALLLAGDGLPAVLDRVDASLEVTAQLPPGDMRPGVLDRLLWVSAGGGWWQLTPGANRHGAPALDVVPVEPADLRAAVGPLLAGVIATAAADRS